MNPAKLHSSLSGAVRVASVDPQPLPIIVRLRQGPVARGEIKAQSVLGMATRYQLLPFRALKADAAEIARLSEDPSVDMIWADLPVHSWLDEAVPLIAVPRVWQSAFTGKGVKVAILDTGIDGAHPDFRGRVAAWKDFVDPDGPKADEPRDPNGHGTHVAGIVAGSGRASEGRFRGVAPEVDLIVARVLDEAGNGRTSTVMAGVEWAVEQGAQVINISLGGPPFPSDGTDALSYLCNAAVDQGVVVCAAAGNLGPSGHTVGSPGAAAKVITVGACEGDRLSPVDRVARFSSRGPTADGRSKPDLVFPGVGIVSARSGGTTLGEVQGEHYTALSGTSQATPLATGTVALVLEANPRLQPAEVKRRLVQGAEALPEAEALAQGAGRGDAYHAFAGSRGQPLGSGGDDEGPGSGGSGGGSRGPGTDPSPRPDPTQPPAPPRRNPRPAPSDAQLPAGCLAALATGWWLR